MAVASARSIEKHDKELNGLHGGAKSAFADAAKNVTVIGTCGTCGGDLVYSAGCTPDRIFCYYCVGDGDKKICPDKYVRDVRSPFNKDWFLNGANPLITIMQIQKDLNGYIVTEENLEIPATADTSFETVKTSE